MTAPFDPIGPVVGPRPEEITRHSFPTARRGLDPEAVNRYLAELADLVTRLRRREAELERRLEAPRAVEPPPPRPLDAAALSAAVGAETGRVLQAAHEAADGVLASAQARAAELVAEAQTSLADKTREAEDAARAITEGATADAAATLASTTEQCREMVEVARAARQRILADLAQRRRELHVQLEQMRAGKDALGEVVDAVASYIAQSVEELKAQLANAEQRTRMAAERAGDAASAAASSASEEDLLTEAELMDGGPPTVAVEVIPGELAALAAVTVEVGAASGSAIDELFAKIRQSRAEQVERARLVFEDDSVASPPRPTDAAEAPPEREGSGGDRADHRAEETPAPEAPQHQSEPTVGGEDPVISLGAPEAEDDADEAAPPDEALVARDELLAPPTGELARVLKRHLRLEQNELLDALRNNRNGAPPAALLPKEEVSGRIAETTLESLSAAFAAGFDTAAASLDLSASTGETPERARRIAAALGEHIAETLSRSLGGSAGNSPEEAVGVVGASFRDWKGSAAEQAAADFAIRAYSEGVLEAAADRGAEVTWLVDDGETRCPDCDDNAIAGALAAGSAFPTGHEHPPIHPGCRCLLVIST